MNDQRPARQQHASTNRTAPGGAHPIPTVEWDLAARIGSGLLPAGPDLPAEQIRQTVEGLRQAAAKAEPIIAEATGLSAPPAAEPYVVDRPTLVRWNIDLAAGLLAPYRQRASLVRRLSGAANAVQVAALFAWVGRQVLGQFDPFADPPRLLLVAPNVAEVGQQAQADPAAFRLWVCLHEVTHRYQFGHAPWLADHLYQLLAEVWQEETSLRSWLFGDTRSGLLGMFSPRGQDLLARGIAVMSLLEGHADLMMDRAGQIPGIRAIRARFQHRREASGLNALWQRVSGLDQKYVQYRDGADFCRQVVDRAGLAGLNRAFDAVELLPSSDEIHNPERWLARVC